LGKFTTKTSVLHDVLGMFPTPAEFTEFAFDCNRVLPKIQKIFPTQRKTPGNREVRRTAARDIGLA
jgi:hypothetical protein